MESKFQGIIIEIGNYPIKIQQAVFVWLGIAVLIGTLLVIWGKKLKQADPTKPPKGVVIIADLYGEFMTKFVRENGGEQNMFLLPYIGTIALMIFFSNVVGLLGLQPPTSNLGINVTLAVISFVLINYLGIKKHGASHYSGLFEPHWALFPVNVIGELAFPVSLSVRLFANILSGGIIMLLFYGLWYWIAGMGVWAPAAVVINLLAPLLHGFFDIFVGFIQTYVFIVLTLFFINQATTAE